MFKKIENQLPTLRRLLNIDLEEDSRAELVEILRTFTAMCYLPSGEFEPHPQNQKILYNFGQCLLYACVCVSMNAYVACACVKEFVCEHVQ